MDRLHDDPLWHELALSAERISQAECELELLGWLPTAAVYTTFERMNRERAYYGWLLRSLWYAQLSNDRDHSSSC